MEFRSLNDDMNNLAFINTAYLVFLKIFNTLKFLQFEEFCWTFILVYCNILPPYLIRVYIYPYKGVLSGES